MNHPPKTIAIDARIIFTSTGRYVFRLIEHLQKLDQHNNYIVLLRRADFDDWNPTAPNFTKQIADYAPYTVAEQVGFAAQLNAMKLDLVHFAMPNYPVLYRKPFVMTVHDLTLINYVNKRRNGVIKDFYKHSVKPAVFARVLSKGLKASKQVITPTDYVRQQLIDQFGVSGEKVTRTYEAGEDLSKTTEAYKELEKEQFILAVGNAYPYKNQGRLIDAFAKLHKKHPKLKLVLVGKTNYFYRELHDYVRDNKIKNVIFTGFANDAQLAWLYKHAKLYAFPSLSEGFSITGLEAMSYGLPVVAANASCLPEVYGKAAIYFDPENTANMAKVIGDTLDDKKLLAKLKKAGKAQVASYSWSRMAQQTLDIYDKALGNR